MTEQGSEREQTGLFQKYFGLRKTKDHQLVGGWYFVIRSGDPFGWPALLAYADAVEANDPLLADGLRDRVRQSMEDDDA